MGSVKEQAGESWVAGGWSHTALTSARGAYHAMPDLHVLCFLEPLGEESIGKRGRAF